MYTVNINHIFIRNIFNLSNKTSPSDRRIWHYFLFWAYSITYLNECLRSNLHIFCTMLKNSKHKRCHNLRNIIYPYLSFSCESWHIETCFITSDFRKFISAISSRYEEILHWNRYGRALEGSWHDADFVCIEWWLENLFYLVQIHINIGMEIMRKILWSDKHRNMLKSITQSPEGTLIVLQNFAVL